MALDITYNELLKNSNQKPNLQIGKWNFLDANPQGILYSKIKSINIAASYFIEHIITDLEENKVISEGQTPKIHILKRHGYGDFLSALTRKNILYNEVVIAAEYIPNYSSVLLNIGTLFHWIVEKLFLEYTRSKGCFSFYEPYVNILTQDSVLYKKYGRLHCDNAIIIDNNFINLTSFAKKFVKTHCNIELITIDYYLGTSVKNLKKKCLKGYQGKGKYLIIVSLSANHPLQNPPDIPFSNNVKILDPISFANFFGFDGKVLEEFLRTVKLAKVAIYDELIRQVLTNFSETNKKILREEFNYSQKEFQKFMESKNKLHLLEYSEWFYNI